MHEYIYSQIRLPIRHMWFSNKTSNTVVLIFLKYTDLNAIHSFL